MLGNETQKNCTLCESNKTKKYRNHIKHMDQVMDVVTSPVEQ